MQTALICEFGAGGWNGRDVHLGLLMSGFLAGAS
jgi:hypothetical protein